MSAVARSRILRPPSSSATSSTTTSISPGATPFSAASLSTATPLRFMNVSGLTSRTSEPPTVAPATHASRASRTGATCVRAASASTTMNPTLWRVLR